MKPTKKWKWLPKYAKFCDDESVEKDYAIKEPKVCDDEIDDERWEVLVLGYFWKNGRPKFKYIIIEKEVECKKEMPIFVNRSKAMM